MNIFIVDDNDGIRSGLKEIFAGFNTITMSTLTEVLETIKDNVIPHIVILDLGLASEDGLQFISTLKAVVPTALIVVYSGHDMIELKDYSFKMGADDFIAKGNLNDLIDVVNLFARLIDKIGPRV